MEVENLFTLKEVDDEEDEKLTYLEINLSWGTQQEINFLDNFRLECYNKKYDMIIKKLKEKKYRGYDRLDFIIVKLNDAYDIIKSYVELKSRKYDKPIDLYISISKIDYVKKHKLKNVFIVWNNTIKNIYYYVLLTDELIEKLLNLKPFELRGQPTIIVDKNDVRTSNRVKNVVKYIHKNIK